MPDNAVFISYARDDLPAVQQMKAGLESAGITTWFDMDRLEGGDDYDRKSPSPNAVSEPPDSRRGEDRAEQKEENPDLTT